MFILGSWIITIYLSLSTIYWLPGISPEILELIKLALIATGMIILWTYTLVNNKIVLPTKTFGLFSYILLIILTLITGFKSDLMATVNSVLDLSLGFITIWTFYLYYNNGGQIEKILKLGAMIVALLAILPLLNSLIGFPDFNTPDEFAGRPFWNIGFSYRSTALSNGLAFFIPIIYMLLIKPYKKFNQKKVAGFVFLFSILGTQFFSGGRAGLLASMICLLIISLVYYSNFREKFIFGLIIVTVSLVLLTVNPDVIEHINKYLQFERLDGLTLDFETLDDFSSGRMSQYKNAVTELTDNPLMGYGFNYTFNSQSSSQIHNLWLRIWIESGFLKLLLLLIFVMNTMIKSIKTLRRITIYKGGIYDHHFMLTFSLLLVFSNGIIISMLEPNTPLGTFQNSFLWWGAIGVLLAINKNKYISS
ncbi:O-antigen ligase family protein [Natranaerobius thermophilus]|uniref:O-antigen ligase-related domain-containing protein n=1 Tax=Natranaerobius thermophilus (strain ATCC BAA-1301 / DSM 18059 / JW/NM-WN-LF) TaxID=457570 RepID=B2A1P5_NATTJ|nr:O-antigen ligase family protein [Natranaerobius thermophilus]ACB86092.1 hypothetical protein Nther_2532 [Natranaerobius thermophilus JW/NM-WN-LF]